MAILSPSDKSAAYSFLINNYTQKLAKGIKSVAIALILRQSLLNNYLSTSSIMSKNMIIELLGHFTGS